SASFFAMMPAPPRLHPLSLHDALPIRAPARIVERSHPDCRKPVRRLFPFQPCHRHAEPRIAAAWAPGPGCRISLSCKNIRLGSDGANPLSRIRNCRGGGGGGVGFFREATAAAPRPPHCRLPP